MRSKLLVLGAMLACTLACEQLLKLDKYQKCDVPCDASGDGGDLDASDASDASDAFVLPDGASEASSWPLWRMENSALEVDSGATDASLATYTSSGGVLVDEVTKKKLIWKTQLGFAGSLDAAASFCSQIGGRLPTRIELATLLDSTRKGPPYITPAFDGIVKVDGGSAPAALWSSSYARPVTSSLQFWFADLKTGDMLVQDPFAGTGVLCVQ